MLTSFLTQAWVVRLLWRPRQPVWMPGTQRRQGGGALAPIHLIIEGDQVMGGQRAMVGEKQLSRKALERNATHYSTGHPLL
jgi:hypothetical protein